MHFPQLCLESCGGAAPIITGSQELSRSATWMVKCAVACHGTIGIPLQSGTYRICRWLSVLSSIADRRWERSERVRSDIPSDIVRVVCSSPGNMTSSGQLNMTSPARAKCGGICFHGKSLPDTDIWPCFSSTMSTKGNKLCNETYRVRYANVS